MEPLLDDFELLGKLGEGAFGAVHMVRHRQTGDTHVVKMSPKDDGEVGGISAWTVRELSICKQLRHPNLLRALDVDGGAAANDSFTAVQEDAYAAGAEGAHVLLYEMALSSDGRADVSADLSLLRLWYLLGCAHRRSPAL